MTRRPRLLAVTTLLGAAVLAAPLLGDAALAAGTADERGTPRA